MKTTLKLFLIASLIALPACDSNEPDEGAGEEELITRVVLTLTGGGGSVTATASDPDGDGANFQITDINLENDVTYTGTIGVFDDVNGENVGTEIEEEDDEHQFFFTPGGGATGRLTVTATDMDSNGLPVGLEFQAVVSAGAATTGTLRVVLSHFDDAPKDGVTMSDETDIDVTFPVNIK